MQRLVLLLGFLLFAAPLFSLVAGEPAVRDGSPRSIVPSHIVSMETDAAAPPAAPSLPEPPFRAQGEDSVFRRAAEIAWRYVEAQYDPSTGLVHSVIHYPYATVWDIGSTLAAYHSAHGLGLLAGADFDARMGRTLATLRSLPLFDGAAFNKNYQIRRAEMAGRSDREEAEGYGWSATDIGRLLVWLRIVASAHPQHAAAARAVVDRLDFDRLIGDGYLRGSDLDAVGRTRNYQEGRLGYEQYAAAGFALWGREAELALSVDENAEAVEVLGVPILRDRRPGAHLTGEPFFLMGIELGWTPAWEDLARQILAAQEARFDLTGQITIATEDAVPVAPHYFYYYTIHDAGEDFAVVTLDADTALAGPRWVSAKGALAWHALVPGPYTWRAVQAVQPAADPRLGWSSGIFEDSGRPTGGQNINTSAVILEAALHHRLRQPLLTAAMTR